MAEARLSRISNLTSPNPSKLPTVALTGAKHGDRIVIEVRVVNGLGKVGPPTFLAHTVDGPTTIATENVAPDAVTSILDGYAAGPITHVTTGTVSDETASATFTPPNDCRVTVACHANYAPSVSSGSGSPFNYQVQSIVRRVSDSALMTPAAANVATQGGLIHVSEGLAGVMSASATFDLLAGVQYTSYALLTVFGGVLTSGVTNTWTSVLNRTEVIKK